MNLYSYVQGNPTNWVDEDGLAPKYVIYAKLNYATKEVYIGKSSGLARKTLAQIVRDRDRGHHMTPEGFGQAIPIAESNNENVIRGLEQRLIDRAGCAKSEGGTAGNPIRGISRDNDKIKTYLKASRRVFGGAAKLGELMEKLDRITGGWSIVLDLVTINVDTAAASTLRRGPNTGHYYDLRGRDHGTGVA